MNGEHTILIADDDETFRGVCEEICLDMGFITEVAVNGKEGLELLKKRRFTLAIVDLKMPKMGGLDLLYHSREIAPGTSFIIITGYGSIESAVEAMKLGAVDYITKPASVAELRSTIKKALEQWPSSRRLTDSEDSAGRFGIVGMSQTMQPVYERIEAMCRSDNTVLIMGESGVGKELVAKAIHFYGERAAEPFIPIECSVLGISVVESELFGHVKGAFTDAQYEKVGLLKLAGKGTVFLDEISEIPMQVQAKLLRAIQEREIRPVGSSKIERIDARIITATNRELKRAVRDGMFREDLFYRLHVIPITVPPLRERIEDIPTLVDHFIKKYNTERRSVLGISQKALQILLSHSWRGNIRELENVIQQAIALGTSEYIRPYDLPHELRYPAENSENSTSLLKPLDELEKEAIIEALRATEGRKLDAARLLGIGKTTLYEKIRRYGIKTSNWQ